MNNHIEKIIRDLRTLAESLQELNNEVIGLTNDEAEKAKKTAAETGSKTSEVVNTPPREGLTFIEVRKLATAKSRMGYGTKVKELIKKYGHSRLSEIDPSDYEAFVTDLRGIGR